MEITCDGRPEGSLDVGELQLKTRDRPLILIGTDNPTEALSQRKVVLSPRRGILLGRRVVPAREVANG